MFQHPNQNKVLARHTEFAESGLAEQPKKPDGRSNNGSKPGEARKKKYKDVGKPTKKKVCHYLSPEHVAKIEARGKGMTATVSEALDLLFAIENGQK